MYFAAWRKIVPLFLSQFGTTFVNSVIPSLMVSLRRRSTSLWLSRRNLCHSSVPGAGFTCGEIGLQMKDIDALVSANTGAPHGKCAGDISLMRHLRGRARCDSDGGESAGLGSGKMLENLLVLLCFRNHSVNLGMMDSLLLLLRPLFYLLSVLLCNSVKILLILLLLLFIKMGRVVQWSSSCCSYRGGLSSVLCNGSREGLGSCNRVGLKGYCTCQVYVFYSFCPVGS